MHAITHNVVCKAKRKKELNAICQVLMGYYSFTVFLLLSEPHVKNNLIWACLKQTKKICTYENLKLKQLQHSRMWFENIRSLLLCELWYLSMMFSTTAALWQVQILAITKYFSKQEKTPNVEICVEDSFWLCMSLRFFWNGITWLMSKMFQLISVDWKKPAY